jgi:hypothetical protein
MLLIGSAGCNVLAMAYFPMYMMGVGEELNIKVKFPPTARVAIVTYAPHATQIEWGRVDKELNDRLYQKVSAYYKGNGRKCKNVIVPAAKVHKWLDEHPDWHEMPADELAKALDTDFIIYVEVENLTFFEKNARFFYQAHAEVKIKVVNVNPEYEQNGIMPEDVVVVDFPTEARPIPADSIPFATFRRSYIDRVAERLSWYFVPHDTADEYKHSFR